MNFVATRTTGIGRTNSLNCKSSFAYSDHQNFCSPRRRSRRQIQTQSRRTGILRRPLTIEHLCRCFRRPTEFATGRSVLCRTPTSTTTARSLTARRDKRLAMAEQCSNFEECMDTNCVERLPGKAEVDGAVSDYAVSVFTSFLETIAANAAHQPLLPESASCSPTTSLRRSKRLQVPGARGNRSASPVKAAAAYNSSSQVNPKLLLCSSFP